MSIYLRTLTIVFLTGLLFACTEDKKEQVGNITKSQTGIVEYPDHVGDIAPDPDLDDPAFETCSSRIPQYYALGPDFRVPNEQLMEHFGTVSLSDKTTTAYFTIRFIVNCKGKIGRLREQSMTTDYKALSLDQDLKTAIRNSLLAFDKWPTGRDFYQYLTFKIEQGKIKEVLP
ncbi:MAG: hypothetical protein Roseis2KO_44590 [Roseivirga sp.]